MAFLFANLSRRGAEVEPIRKALEQALSHYEKKQYADAERGADSLLEAYPDFNRALFLKAVILEETGRSGEADQFYRKAGPLFSLWFRLALQLQKIDPERALKYFEKVSSTDPEDNLIWYSMGNIYERLGKLDEAKKCFQRISLQREIVSRLLSPLGFFIIMVAGSVAMLKHGDKVLSSLVILSAIVCLFWLKRDGRRALEMMRKRNKYR
jgi:tetratricopeptide (TPR) repeat protein